MGRRTLGDAGRLIEGVATTPDAVLWARLPTRIRERIAQEAARLGKRVTEMRPVVEAKAVAQIKAKAHAVPDAELPITWSNGPLEITVRRARWDADNDVLSVLASATHEGEPVDLNLPLVYVNPPLLVRDPANDEPPTEDDDGRVVDDGRAYVEDVRTALRQMIEATVERALSKAD